MQIIRSLPKYCLIIIIGALFSITVPYNSKSPSEKTLLYKNVWASDKSDIEKINNLIPVPLVRQATDYTCGASALQSVLGFYGENIREDVIAKAVGSDPENGTRFQRIAKYAKMKGYNVLVKTKMTLQNLKNYIDRKIPVIVLIQAWPDNHVNWVTDYDDGHYAVVIGYDSKNIYFMDPSTLGNYTYIPVQEFMNRWHDRESEDVILNHFGMVIFKKRQVYDNKKILRLE